MKFIDERRVVLSVAPEFNVKTEKKFLNIRDDKVSCGVRFGLFCLDGMMKFSV